MTVLAPKTRKPTSSRTPKASGTRTIVGMAVLLIAAVIVQNWMRPTRDDTPDISSERNTTGNHTRSAFASPGRPAPIRDSTIRIESRKPRYIVPRPPPPAEVRFDLPLIDPNLMARQVHVLREYAANAEPGDPLAATEEDIESLRRHGSPLTW